MIVGITGPFCSGTNTVGSILLRNGFEKFSLADYLRVEMKKLGIKENRKNMQDFGDKLRKEGGPGAIVKLSLPSLDMNKDYVIESVRNPGEVEELRKLGDNFVLLLVDASAEIRFRRLLKRARDEDEPKTFEEFRKWEERDLGVGQPKYGQQQSAVFEMADKTIVNNGSFEDLKKEVETLIYELRKA